MTGLIVALLALLFVSTAQAQIGAAAGGTRDWVRTTTDGEWLDRTTFMPMVEYHFGLDENGPIENGEVTSLTGLTVGFRGSDDVDAKIQEYSVGYWSVGLIEWFVDGVFEVWDKTLTGENEFLGGGRIGIRGNAIEGLPIEVSGRYTMGADGKAHPGLFLGVYK